MRACSLRDRFEGAWRRGERDGHRYADIDKNNAAGRCMRWRRRAREWDGGRVDIGARTSEGSVSLRDTICRALLILNSSQTSSPSNPDPHVHPRSSSRLNKNPPRSPGPFRGPLVEVCACLCAPFCVGFPCAGRGGRGQVLWLSLEVSCGNSAAAPEAFA
jgi:hypothetical protein